jgi:hypothetical protein
MRLGFHQSSCSLIVAACLALGGVLGVVLGGDAPASGAEAVVIPVRLPITGTRDTQVEAAILRHLGRLRGTPLERGTLVLRFDAVDGESAGGSLMEAPEHGGGQGHEGRT